MAYTSNPNFQILQYKTQSDNFFYTHEYISRTLNMDWSFGKCLTDNLNALHRLAWAYLPPAYLLSLVLISLFLSRFHRFARIFSRSTVARMFWQFILLSFNSLSCTSFQLLKCVHLKPEAVFEKHNLSNLRFAYDANLECFAGDHLPWAIVASVIVATFCIPLPLSIPFLHHFPTCKPYSDVYSSLYKDNRRWWCSVDLLRRLLLAAVYVAEDNIWLNSKAMILICIIFFFLHALFSPYASKEANMIEMVLLLCLVVITVLNDPNITSDMTIKYFRVDSMIFLVFFSLLLAYMARKEWKSTKWAKRRKQEQGIAFSAQQDDMLREVLLADENTPF